MGQPECARRDRGAMGTQKLFSGLGYRIWRVTGQFVKWAFVHVPVKEARSAILGHGNGPLSSSLPAPSACPICVGMAARQGRDVGL